MQQSPAHVAGPADTATAPAATARRYTRTLARVQVMVHNLRPPPELPCIGPGGSQSRRTHGIALELLKADGGCHSVVIRKRGGQRQHAA